MQNGGTSFDTIAPAADERRLAEADELVHAARARRRWRGSPTVTWPAERDAVGEDDGVAEAAVVRDVRRHHEEAAAADARLHAAALGAGIERDVLAHDVGVADRRAVLGSPRYLRSCGMAADAGEREDAIARTDGGAPLDHGVRTRPRCPAPIRTCGPTTAYGPIAHAVARARRAATRRRSDGRCGPDGCAEPELDLGDHGVGERHDPPEAPDRAAGQRVHLEPERVARHDGTPEARRAARRASATGPSSGDHRGTELCQRLAQQHPGHHRDARGSGPRSTARWR